MVSSAGLELSQAAPLGIELSQVRARSVLGLVKLGLVRPGVSGFFNHYGWPSSVTLARTSNIGDLVIFCYNRFRSYPFGNIPQQ